MKTGLNTKEDLPMEKQAGLTGQEVEERIRSGQVNRMENHMVKTNKEIVKAHLLTYFNFLNLFLAILVLITGQFKNMTFMGVVIVNAVIGIVQELKVKKVVDKLTVLTASKAHVVREGEKYEIDIEEVVKDDILIVTNGDQICADCTVLECDGLEVNESMLTGESKPVKKKAGDELMSGSFVVAGGGVGRVVHVGDENYAAELTRKAKTKKRATSEMQNTIKRIIAVVSILIIPIGSGDDQERSYRGNRCRNHRYDSGGTGAADQHLVYPGRRKTCKKAGTRAGDGSNRSTGTRQRALP